MYGVRRNETLTEESQPHPTDMYGHSKMLAEQQITAFGGGLGYTIFRTATLYGQGFESSFFRIFKMLVAGKAYIVGDGENVLALVHTNDATRALRTALTHKNATRKTFILSDGKRYTQEYLLRMASEALHVPAPTKHVSSLLLRMMGTKVGFSNDEIRFITSNRMVDIGRIKKELGFRPRVEITAATKALVEEYSKNHRH